MHKPVKVSHPIKWEGNENIIVTIRYKENKKIHTKKVRLVSLYKMGVEFIPVFYKNGNPKGFKSVGYIIDNEYHKIENLQTVFLRN